MFVFFMSTKENIVTLADQLLRTRGYNAFSYKDLSGPLNIKNAAVHYHFPAKSDVAVAVVDRTIQAFSKSRRQWEALPVKARLRNFITIYADNNEAHLICLMGSLAPDYQTLPPSVQQRVRTMGNDILDWLTHCLAEGQQSEEIVFIGEPYDKALAIVASLLSSLLLGRVLGQEVATRIHQQLIDEITT